MTLAEHDDQSELTHVDRDQATLTELAEMFGLRGKATVTVEEAAALLQVSRGTCYEAVRTGDLPSLRLGRRLLIPVPALLNLLRNL